MKVLQTSPLATWVRRLSAMQFIIGFLFLACQMAK